MKAGAKLRHAVKRKQALIERRLLIYKELSSL